MAKQRLSTPVTLTQVNGVTTYKLGSPLVADSLTIQTGTFFYAISGTRTLSQNVDISPDPAITYYTGSGFEIQWGCIATVGIYTISIAGFDMTTVLTGTVNTTINLNYDGTSWQIDSTAKDIKTALTPYALISSIAGYIATALAAFTGSSAIVTLGTIVTGVWHGSPIADAYISSAASWNAKAPLASPALTGTPTAATAAVGTNTTQLANTAFVQAAVSPLNVYYNDPNPWTAGTYDLQAIATGVYNTVDLTSVTGNIIIAALGAPTTNISEVTLNMPIAGGAYTVTAGALVEFTIKTGVDTHTMVLTLAWSDKQGKYIQKAFSQN